MSRFYDFVYQIGFHLLDVMSEGIVACTEKTDRIIFDVTTLIQMLPVLSKTAKVTFAAIVPWLHTLGQLYLLVHFTDTHCLQHV